MSCTNRFGVRNFYSESVQKLLIVDYNNYSVNYMYFLRQKLLI